MATNKAYISAGASPTKKSTDTPTNNSVYVSAGVSPVYVPSGPVVETTINYTALLRRLREEAA